MSPTINVRVHWSQLPERVRSELQASLRQRKLNHKFLYDSLRQTTRWLALHQAYSPSRNDPDCAATYDRGFATVVERLPVAPIHLVGLGCGGGQKDTRLASRIRQSGRNVIYTPADVSTALVLVAAQAAQEVLPPNHCFPLVCDLAIADDLAAELAKHDTNPGVRLITFFGMIPNFEPDLILKRLAALIRPGDLLLFSANLAPGSDYEAGVKQILPLYDNSLTRDWLLAFLTEIGVDPADGEVRFSIEADAANGLRRIIARFHFTRPRTVELDGERYGFLAGEVFQLFFSYRHTPQLIRGLLQPYGMRVLDEWITRSGEEGVFLVGV